VEGYNAKVLHPDEIHANWGVLLPLLKNLEPRDWNGTYAKLLTGECKAILVEYESEAAVAIITIGKHGGTDGFNTCFIDVLAASKGITGLEPFKAMLDKICVVARKAGCDGIIGDTPNKRLSELAKQLGFNVTPMFKLGRYI